ncbi:hypothetical protein ZOSMA_454G00020 [Zostera marina]|uniref:Uncharacterized protein n=1 Tax=Zostera marina TaxID=29655 RepID=A0A0K9P2U5_ZOSMR|nr:hypothetical protein ZOSMA_454G00020 [Zostera marina]
MKEEKAIHELNFNLEDTYDAKEMGFIEIQSLRMEKDKLSSEKALLNEEFKSMQHKLLGEENQRKYLEDEVARYKRLCFDIGLHMEDNLSNSNSVLRRTRSGFKSNRSMDTISSQRATISKILEAVGLQNVISLLGSCDLDVQIHAAKLIANLSSKGQSF